MRGGAGIRAGARGGNSGPARGVRGFGARSAGWGGDSSPARSGVEIRSRARGGRNSGPSAGWGGDSGPGAGCELFGVRWEIFYLFAVFSPFG